MLYVVPDCGLQIEIKETNAHLYDLNKPVKYTIKDTACFTFKDSQARYSQLEFDGVMSPSQEVTLPSEVRKIAGIPAKAERFAYMHPPFKLASLIDWERQKEVESFQDNPRDRGQRDPSKQTDKAHAILLGAFVYFGSSMDVLSVNAISLEPSDYDIKLTGPWAMTDTAIHGMVELGRFQKLEIDIFNEGGLVGIGWVSPGELFQSEAVSIKGGCPNGAFTFLREDGSGICYHIEESDGIYFPQEDVEILVDCIQGIGLELESGNLTFDTSLTGTIRDANMWDFSDALGWKTSLLEGKSLNLLQDELEDRGVDRSLVLHKACQVGTGLDQELVNRIINEVGGNALRTSDSRGWTPLHYACRFSSANIELIKLLVHKYDDAVEKKDKFGRLPLHLACDGNAPVEAIQILLENHKDTVLAETDYMKMIPLHIACNREAHVEVVKALLDADVQDISVGKQSLIGRLPLHMAIEEKMHPDVVDLLLEKGRGEDIYKKFGGLLPLHLACLNGSKAKTIQILLDKDLSNKTINEAVERADNNSKDVRAKSLLSLTTIGIDGMIPLHLALRNTSGDVKTRSRVTESIHLLLMKEKKLKRVADLERCTVYFQNKHTFMSPLHLACQNNARLDVIQMLLDLDPDNRVIHFKDKRGMKPIHYACNKANADPEVLKRLLYKEKEGLMNRSGIVTKLSSELNGATPKRDKMLTHSLDIRERSPLLTAVTTGAPSSVVEILTRPENLSLKGFDDHSIRLLGAKVNQSEEMKRHIVTILADRSYFTILFLELYAHTAAIVAFIEGSEKLLNGKLTTFEPAVLSSCIGMFIIREAAQVKSQGWNYFKDIWNAPELLLIFSLTASVIHMKAFSTDELNDIDIDRDLMILTGFLLIITFIFFCRSTFLPFARFVGGLLLILATLVPFFTISSLLLLAFTYSFRISGNHDEACSTLSKCYFWTLQGFFSGSDDTRDTLDILFGIVAIVILLNVVVAIVGDAWELATEEASSMYWSFRLGYMLESRAFAIIQKKISSKFGFFVSLAAKIDRVQSIAFNDNVAWSKGVYSQVTSKDQYDHPELYFDPITAKKIKNARSLKSDLFWAKIESRERRRDQKRIQEEIKNGNMVTEEEKMSLSLVSNRYILRQNALLRFVCRCAVYLLLVALGIPFGGWFWPVGFRRAILSLGINIESEKRVENSFDGDTEEKIVMLMESTSRERRQNGIPASDQTASFSEEITGISRSIPFAKTVSSLSNGNIDMCRTN